MNPDVQQNTRTQAAEARTLIEAQEARKLLGVGAFSSHQKMPAFLDNGLKSLSTLKLFDLDSLPPDKKRERIMMMVIVVAGTLYLGNMGWTWLTTPPPQASMQQIVQDPQFKAHLEAVKAERKSTETTPEDIQEAYKRFKTPPQP